MNRLVRLWLRIRLAYLRSRQRETSEAGERMLEWSAEYGTDANKVERKLRQQERDGRGEGVTWQEVKKSKRNHRSQP